MISFNALKLVTSCIDIVFFLDASKDLPYIPACKLSLELQKKLPN